MKQSIVFDEYSMWTQKKYDYDWYEWCVFVSGNEEELSTIEAVKYTLHPSFPDPVREIKNRSGCFGLFSSGWGGFTIGIVITFVDGTTNDASHFLKLFNNWPKKGAPGLFDDQDQELVYQALLHEKYRWRKLSTIQKKTTLPDDRVLSALHKLEKGNFVRKSYFQSVDNQDMWGASSVVGITPRPHK